MQGVPKINAVQPNARYSCFQESFSEWRRRVQEELGQVDVADSSGDEDDVGNSGTMRSGAGDGSFTWKTLEEETKELMKQLERLRLQEVTKIKAVMVRTKDEYARKVLRAEKQKNVLATQVSHELYFSFNAV
jgi:hypothetical protein